MLSSFKEGGWQAEAPQGQPETRVSASPAVFSPQTALFVVKRLLGFKTKGEEGATWQVVGAGTCEEASVLPDPNIGVPPRCLGLPAHLPNKRQ